MGVPVRTVSKEIEFDAGHRVPNHKSKCRNPHGHRYRLRVTIAGDLVTTPGASDEGMLADFGDLKNIMATQVHDVLDHGFIVFGEDDPMLYALGVTPNALSIVQAEGWKVIVTDFIPTAENLAEWCWNQLKPWIEPLGFTMQLVELWETPTSLATYFEV
jgi:6-pyruvoyltetrahydropterin/6-carboxytetrahydropterin synthase